MKIAAFVLGLISGVIGIVLAFITLFMGGITSALSSDRLVGTMGIIALFLTLLIIIFSSIILAKPKQAGILLLGTSIGSMIAGGTLVAVASVLALIASILAYIEGRKEKNNQSKQKSYVLWTISILLVVIPISIVYKVDTPSQSASALIDLDTAKIDNISSKGILHDTFEIGSNYTDVQRQNLEEQITGKVVEWTLPVYEISKISDNTYKIQTDGSNGDVGTFIVLSPKNSQEIKLLMSLKTGDQVSVKGYIKGISIRNIELSPAQLITGNNITQQNLSISNQTVSTKNTTVDTEDQTIEVVGTFAQSQGTGLCSEFNGDYELNSQNEYTLISDKDKTYFSFCERDDKETPITSQILEALNKCNASDSAGELVLCKVRASINKDNQFTKITIKDMFQNLSEKLESDRKSVV